MAASGRDRGREYRSASPNGQPKSQAALGHVAVSEMPLAILIMLASIYWVARLEGRIYATSLVRAGARLSWRAALRFR